MKLKLQAGPPTMLAGYLLLSGMPAFVRLLGQQGWGAASTTAVRFGIGVVFLLVSIFGLHRRIATRQPWILVLRGAFGALAVLTYFLAVQLTGSGMGTLLNYTHSIWSNVLGVILFRKRPAHRFWLYLGLALVGLWLVINPSVTRLEPGKLYGLASGFFGGASILCIKRLRETDSALTIMASFTTFGFLLACFALPFESKSLSYVTTPHTLAYLTIIAVLSFAGQLLFTHGYRETSVALGSLLSLLVPVIATFVGWLVLSELLTWSDGVGAVFVLSACFLFGRSEFRGEPHESAGE